MDEETAMAATNLAAKDRSKSSATSAHSDVAQPSFEDLATVGHEINRSSHYATSAKPYLSQLRAKCEKQKYEKEDPGSKDDDIKNDKKHTNTSDISTKKDKLESNDTATTHNHHQADGLQYRL